MKPTSAIVTINHLGIIQSADKGCCRMFSYEVSDLLEQKIDILIPTPYREQHDNYMQRYLQSKNPRIIGKSRVVEGRRKDGTIFPLRLFVSAINQGDNVLFIGMMEEIHDQAGVLTVSEDGSVISCNANIESLTGYTAQDLMGHNVSTLAPADSIGHPLLAVKGASASNAIRNVRIMLKKGSSTSVSLQIDCLTVTGITFFRLKLNPVPEDTIAVFSVDGGGIILSCNRTFIPQLFGFAASELRGRHISVLLPELQEWQDGTYPDGTLFNTIQSPSKDLANGISVEDTQTDNADAANVCLAQKRPREDEERAPSGKRAKCVWEMGVREMSGRHKDGSSFRALVNVTQFFTQEGETLFSASVSRLTTPLDGDDSDSDSYLDSGSDSSGSLEPGLPMSSSSSGRTRVIGDYNIHGRIGFGSYGKVKLGTHRVSKENVAVKILQKDLMDVKELERAVREIDIMKTLDHKNICKLYQSIETPSRLYIMMELAENGELYSYIVSRGKLSEAEAREFFKQIVYAVDYCHRKNIIHRDIKHKNILLDKDHNIKLIDFGLSNFTVQGGLRSTFCGTPAYSAPEMILAKKYSGPEVDIWSMGVVLYSMLMGEFPFKTVSDIITANFTCPEHLSEDCGSMLRGIFNVDPKLRMTVAQIMEHPWFLKEEVVVRPHLPVEPLVVHSDPGSEASIKSVEFEVLPDMVQPPS